MSADLEVLDIGDEVPNFNLESQVGMISFHEMIDAKWCVLVTYRTAFEPVGTTDIGTLTKMLEEFEARNIAVLIVGHENVSNIRRWIADIEDIQTTRVKIPIMCDPDCQVLRRFGCAKLSAATNEIKPTSLGVFLIDIDKRIRSCFRYSPMTGRNFYEVLRTFDALQLVTHHRVVCPCNWGAGQDVMLAPNISVEEATEYRSAEIRPWFKLTPCPEL